MPERTDGPPEEEPDDERDEVVDTMKDVDHTHPDTDESFTETGVYDRGKDRPGDDGD